MTPSFYGSVLKAIACTPNRNPDAAAYTAEVLPKARRLRERQTASAAAPPTDADARAAVTDLVSILRFKQVTADEIRERVEDVLRTHPGLPAAAHFLGISHG